MLLPCLAMMLTHASVPVERGRDPWVFRAVFEDRPHSLLIAAGQNVWFAFNTTSCAFHKVWLGGVDLKGKVYDFSQENSQAQGKVLAKSYQEVFALPTQLPLPEGWTSRGLRIQDKGFRLTGDGAYLESPPLDLSAFSNLYVAFDEQSRRGRLRVEVRNEGKVTEWFQSSTDVSSETAWMWNFKYLLDRGTAARIRFSQDRDSDQKGLRAVRLYGDRPGWALQTPEGVVVARPIFRGYETHGTDWVKIRFDLVAGGYRSSLEVRPEVVGGRWQLGYRVLRNSKGTQPVMLGWNAWLGNGDSITWRGMAGRAILTKEFLAEGDAR
ncbi:MAG: hypothetical protein ACOYON_14450 [Fimbriimonas sp.]